MELAPCPSASRAPERCDARARRLVQVKFIALPMDFHDEPVIPQARPASLSGRIYRSVSDLLYRAVGRLVAARP